MLSTKMEGYAAQIVQSVQKYVKAKLDPIVGNVAALVQRVDAQQETMKSFERRASRHAEHLSRLESRLQSLEQKGGQ